MKALSVSIVIASVIIGSAAVAKGPPDRSARNGVTHLNNALSAVGTTLQATTPPPKTVDNDQGDDHANPGAILRVCSKDTPAARRSAICPISVSPE